MCADYSGRRPNCNAAPCGQTAAISLTFPGLAACGRKAGPLRERRNRKRADGQIEVQVEAEIRRKPRPERAGRRDLLTRIADALERLAPRPTRRRRFRRRRRLRLAAGGPRGSCRCRASTGSRCRCSRASTACATCWSRTPSASPRACRPTTRCCGARAAWASRRWSRPSHAAVNASARARPARSSWSRSTARTSRACPT